MDVLVAATNSLPDLAMQELAYDGALKRLSSTPRESASAANSRRSSMLSRIGSNQVSSQNAIPSLYWNVALPL